MKENVNLFFKGNLNKSQKYLSVRDYGDCEVSQDSIVNPSAGHGSDALALH